MKKNLLRSAVCFICALVCSFNLSAQEWSRFRGKNGEGVGHATKVPNQWNENDLNWKTPLPGIGHSSPIQFGETIFVQSADPDSATRFVVAVNANTGKIKWQEKFAAGKHRFHTLNSYNSSTPAADAKHVYVAWSDTRQTKLKALTHAGDEVWSKELGTWTGQHGFAASPIVYKNMVIIANSQQKDQLRPGQKAGQSVVYAFNAADGKLVWKSERVTNRVSYAVPCIYKNSDGADELVCCNRGEGVYSLNPKTGKRNWAYESAFDKRTVSSPVIAGGLIFGSCGSGGGGNFVVAIKPGSNPTLEYKIDKSANYVPTPVVFKDLLFVVSDKGVATCARVSDGKVVWRERLDGAYWASPIRIGERIFVVNDKGRVTVLSAGPEFKVLGKSELGEKSHSTPAVAGGKLILRSVSHLYSVGG